MNALALIHGSAEPILYGLVIFFGLLITLNKLLRGEFLSFMCDITVFWLVFTLHGHSMTGGFAATIGALLAGVFFPRMIRGAWK